MLSVIVLPVSNKDTEPAEANYSSFPADLLFKESTIIDKYSTISVCWQLIQPANIVRSMAIGLIFMKLHLIT